MIYIIDESNKLIGPINSWNTFHPKGKIKRMIITDNFSIYDTLEGFDYYYMEKEAISFQGQYRNICTRIEKETIFGILDLSEVKQKLLEAFNNKLKKILQEKKDVQRQLDKSRKRYNDLLNKIENQEISYISLIVNNNKCRRDQVNINDKFFKKGQGRKKTIEDILGKNYAKKL